MKKNKYKTWSDSFEHQNKTTTWSYGHFQKLIETECKFKTNLTLVEVGVARGGHIRHLLDNFGDNINKIYGVDPHLSGYDRKDLFSRKGYLFRGNRFATFGLCGDIDLILQGCGISRNLLTIDFKI